MALYSYGQARAALKEEPRIAVLLRRTTTADGGGGGGPRCIGTFESGPPPRSEDDAVVVGLDLGATSIKGVVARSCRGSRGVEALGAVHREPLTVTTFDEVFFYFGIVGGMSVARVWACRYSK